MSIIIKNQDDPMRDLYPTCGQAFKAGERHGVDDALDAAIDALRPIYLKHETASDPSKFHAVGECLVELRRMRKEAWDRNSLRLREPEGSA